jgi:oligo-1,6-glucosidase
MQEKWWQRSVVYQIYPRSFMDSNGDGIGDLNGIRQRLPYLKDLGIDVIWLSPIYKSPNVDNGYDISDYQAIMEEFGTMEDFDRLLEEAHAMKIRIILDLVVNHSSDQHQWFQESRKSIQNPYRDYYIWRDPVNGHAPNNQGSCVGGSAWTLDETTGQFYMHLFDRRQPDLNWDNPVLRDEVYRMMDWWLQKGIDGFRMDVISLISKDQSFPDYPADKTGYAPFDIVANGPHEHEYLREMNHKVLSRYDVMTVGECPGVTLEGTKQYANLDGSELSMVFSFEHMSVDADPAFSRYVKKLPLNLVKLKKIMSRWQTQLDGIAWNSLFWDNHDQPRIVSRWGDDSERYHDLSAKMLATCLHMMQGTPYIFEGEELGMTNYPWKNLSEMKDNESLGNYRQAVEKGIVDEKDAFTALRTISRDNARTPMQWDEGKNAGFSSGTPWMPVNPNYVRYNAKDEQEDADSVYHYYQKLIQLRHDSDLIVHGHYQLLDQENPDLFCYEREWNGEKLLVICNFTKKEISWNLPEEFDHAGILISNGSFIFLV